MDHVSKEQLEKAAKEGIKDNVPGLLRGGVEKAVLKLLGTDLNKDGIADIVQVLNLAIDSLEILGKANECIDFVAAVDAVDDLPFIKDKPAFKVLLQQLAAKAEAAGKLAPKG